MKKYLFLAIAALGLVACADKQDDNSAIQNGELEESYIAINLMSADLDTRAAEDSFGYEDGTDKEREIQSAYFFFFDENGNPFNVLGAPATAPGGSKNYLSLTITPTPENANINVSDISNAVLILNTYKGVYPSKIVAVLNWTPVAQAYSLSDLHSTLATLGDDTSGYVMSNSVYMDGAGKMVDAVPLTTEHIKTSATEATANPIDIYVERIAAKVVLTAGGKVANTTNIFSTQKSSSLVGASGSTPVFVQLHGWELFNDFNQSYLIKDIDTGWTVENLGFNWNDYSYFRCYWAESPNVFANPDEFAWEYNDDTQNSKGFLTNYGFGIADQNDNYQTRSTYTYCGENTNGEALRTKVILKGQLMKMDGENYVPLELASWYGNEYAGNEALRTAVANSLKFTLYSSADGVDFDSITPNDIECVAGNVVGAEAYEVGFQLSNTGLGKTWYTYDSTNLYQPLGDIANTNADETNSYLKTNVEPALLYAEGQTYYIVDIEHLGATGKTAEYGVVRNHVYQIDIKSINGYGSPVYNGLSNIVTPEYPEKYDDTYVAARINVLSWKIVKQGVDIVQ